MNPDQFVGWLRDTSPYVRTHRGRTVVIAFGGEMLGSDAQVGLFNDIALLSTLGVRTVLVHGCRPQLAARLDERGIDSHMATTAYGPTRVTPPAAMECVQEVVGTCRAVIEAGLSVGLTNAPHPHVPIPVVGGNWITARPIGIRDGLDFEHTGQVRRIDDDAIRQHLSAGEVVVLSPVGYSPTGEAFNLYYREVAQQTAIALNAEKLILLTDTAGLTDESGQLVRELTLPQARQRLKDTPASDQWTDLNTCVEALSAGVQRAHLLDRNRDGALLLELFTRDGVGTLVAADTFDDTRAATIDDVGGILALIAPLEEAGVLVRRSREQLETEIGDFLVMERDGMVIACASCHIYPADGTAELACLSVHSDYQKSGRAAALLAQVERHLANQQIDQLFVLTTQTSHWFLEHGFTEAALSTLPPDRQQTVQERRNAKVLQKPVHARRK